MVIFSNVVLFFAIAAAIVFSLLVLFTGKGDAMSGGGSVRTSYKGKATFDDIMSKASLILGISFMGLVLLYTVLTKRIKSQETLSALSSVSAPIKSTVIPSASNNTPATNSPAASNNTPATNSPAASNNASPGSITPADNNAPKK